MKNVLASWIVFLSGFLVVAPSLEAQNLTPQQRQELVLTRAVSQRGPREFAIIAQAGIEAGRKYDENPAQFQPHIRLKTGGYETLSVPSRNEVVTRAMEAANTQLTGIDLSDNVVVAGLIGAAAIYATAHGGPYAGSLVTIGGAELKKHLIFEGQAPPEWDNQTYKKMLDQALNPSDRDVAKAIESYRGKLKDDQGTIDPKKTDYSLHPYVQKAETLATSLRQQKSSAAMIKVLSDMNKRLAGQEQSSKEVVQWIHDQKNAEVLRAQQEYEREEIVGTLMVAQYTFQFMGDQKSARFMSKSVVFAEKAIDLYQHGAQMAPMYAAAGYFGLVLMAVDMFSSMGESDSQAELFHELQKIAEMIENLRQEMHARFDIVEIKLNQLLDSERYNFEKLLSATQNIQDQLVSIRNQASRDKSEILSKIGELADEQYLSSLQQCIDYRSGHFLPIPQSDAMRCVSFFDSYANEFSIFDSAIGGDLGTNYDFLYPYSEQALTLVAKARAEGQDDFYRSVLLSSDQLNTYVKTNSLKIGIPKEEAWILNSNLFADYYWRQRSKTVNMTEGKLINFLEAGKKLAQFHRGLSFKPVANSQPPAMTIRKEFLTNLIDEYAAAMKGALSVIEENSKHAVQKHEYLSVDLREGKNQSQDYQTTFTYYKKKQLPVCSNFRGRAEPKDLFPVDIGQPQSVAYDAKWKERLQSDPVVAPLSGVDISGSFKGLNFEFSDDLTPALPPIVRLGERLGLYTIDFCLSEVQFGYIPQQRSFHGGAPQGFLKNKYHFTIRAYEMKDPSDKDQDKTPLAELTVQGDTIMPNIMAGGGDPMWMFHYRLWNGFEHGIIKIFAVKDMFKELRSKADGLNEAANDKVIEALKAEQEYQSSYILRNYDIGSTNLAEAFKALRYLDAAYQVSLKYGLSVSERKNWEDLVYSDSGLPGLKVLIRQSFENGLKTPELEKYIDQKASALKTYIEELSKTPKTVGLPMELEFTLNRLGQVARDWKDSQTKRH